LLGGRLWIRRVYDSRTAPQDGLLIDDLLAEIDWNDPNAPYGKAVYRALGEGRWVVSVTGDGSLGLARAESDVEVVLSEPPPVRDYEKIEDEIDASISEVTLGDVAGRVFTPSR
jgi:hypothetical protein